MTVDRRIKCTVPAVDTVVHPGRLVTDESIRPLDNSVIASDCKCVSAEQRDFKKVFAQIAASEVSQAKFEVVQNWLLC